MPFYLYTLTWQIYWCFPRSKASFMEGWIQWICFSFSCLFHMLMWVWQRARKWSFCFTMLGCNWLKFWSLSVIWCEEWKCYCLLEGSWWICYKGICLIHQIRGRKNLYLKCSYITFTYMQLAAPEEHLLVSSSLDRTLRIWDLRR